MFKLVHYLSKSNHLVNTAQRTFNYLKAGCDTSESSEKDAYRQKAIFELQALITDAQQLKEKLEAQ